MLRPLLLFHLLSSFIIAEVVTVPMKDNQGDAFKAVPPKPTNDIYDNSVVFDGDTNQYRAPQSVYDNEDASYFDNDTFIDDVDMVEAETAEAEEEAPEFERPIDESLDEYYDVDYDADSDDNDGGSRPCSSKPQAASVGDSGDDFSA